MGKYLDVRRDYDNYRKRDTRVSISNPDLNHDTNNLILFQLPTNVYVTRVFVDVVKADSNNGSTIDVVVVPNIPKPTFASIDAATDVLADEIDVSSTGLKVCDTCKMTKLDGDYIVVARDGDVPGNGDGAFAVVVEYIEFTNCNEELTQIPYQKGEMIEE